MHIESIFRVLFILYCARIVLSLALIRKGRGSMRKKLNKITKIREMYITYDRLISRIAKIKKRTKHFTMLLLFMVKRDHVNVYFDLQ